MVQIGFHPEDDKFIRYHNAKTGNTYQHFVEHAVKKEIKLLEQIEEAEKKRQLRKSLNKS